MKNKKIHFDAASEDELALARVSLAAWFEQLPAEARAEVEAQARRDAASQPLRPRTAGELPN